MHHLLQSAPSRAVWHRVLLAFTLLSVTLIMSGCFLAPVIDSFKRAGITASDRKVLLNSELKQFTEQLRWNRVDGVLGRLEPTNRLTLESELRAMLRTERITDCQIEGITWGEDATEATVQLTMRSYRVPVYTIDERSEQQRWVFSYSDGWKLRERILPVAHNRAPRS